MNWFVAFFAAASAVPAVAFAQQSPPPAQTAAPRDGVLVYGPDFFAGSALDTALEMVQRLPGFTLDTGNNDARGLAGNSGNVLIDGKPPASKTDGLAEVLRRISAPSILRIELIRGGAPGIDMLGHAVIANVVLKRTESTERVVDATAYVYTDGYVGPQIKGQYTHRNGDSHEELAVSATTDRTSGTAHGDRTRTDGAGALLQQSDLDLWDRYRNANIRGNIQRLAGGGMLRVNALVDYTNLNTSQTVTVLAGAGSDGYAEDVTHRWSGELGVNWTRALGKRGEIEIIALQRGGHESYDSSVLSAGLGSTFTAGDTTGESILRTIGRFRPDKRWAFEAGGEIAYNFLDSNTLYAENGARVMLPNESVYVSELRAEAFAQATWQPSTQLTLEAAMRGEYSRIANSGDVDLAKYFVYPKPRLQLTWRPAKGHQLRFRLEKTVSQLDFGDFAASTEINFGTVAAGNANLEPEKTLTLEAVYEFRFWKKGALELSALHESTTDVIDYIPLVGGYDAVGNIGDGTRDIFEAKLTLPFDKLGIANARLKARASVRQSHVTDPVTGKRRRYANEIPFGCGVTFSHDLKGGKFTYGVDHGCNVDSYDSYRVRELRMARIPPQLTIFAIWKPSKTLTLRADLGNATDGASTNYRNVYSGPRNAAPILYRERRVLTRGQYLFLQARKTF